MTRYGMVAGNGKFPFLVLEAARTQGHDVVVAAIKEETFPDISEHSKHVEWMGIGQLGRLIKYFKREGVTHAMIGRGKARSDIQRRNSRLANDQSFNQPGAKKHRFIDRRGSPRTGKRRDSIYRLHYVSTAAFIA